MLPLIAPGRRRLAVLRRRSAPPRLAARRRSRRQLPLVRTGSACLDIFATETTLGTEGREATIVYTLREECAGRDQRQSRNPCVIALTVPQP